MLQLCNLLGYDAIVIQCRNIPDVDAIASGFVRMRFFEEI